MDETDSQEPVWVPRAKAGRKTILGLSAGVTILLLATVTSHLLGLGSWDDATMLGVWGIEVSALGVALAVVIYLTQKLDEHSSTVARQALLSDIQLTVRETGQDVKRALSDLASMRAQIRGTQVPAEESGEDEEDPFSPDGQAKLEQDGALVYDADGKSFTTVDASGVPLKAISDVVLGWEYEELQGKWLVANLVGGFRATGQGNHAWYLLFRNSQGALSYWRVARGGQGKTDASVTQWIPSTPR